MSKILLMQRANGELFQLSPNLIVIWPGKDALVRSITYHRELDLYRPIALEGKVQSRLQKEADKFWLVASSQPTAPLTEGRCIDWPEINRLQAQQEPEEKSDDSPKVRATIQEFQFH